MFSLINSVASLFKLKYRIFCLVKRNIIGKIQIIGLILAATFDFLNICRPNMRDVVLKFEIQIDSIIFELFESVEFI